MNRDVALGSEQLCQLHDEKIVLELYDHLAAGRTGLANSPVPNRPEQRRELRTRRPQLLAAAREHSSLPTFVAVTACHLS